MDIDTWTETTRRKHARKGLRYSSYLTDEDWAVLEPLMPARSWLGRPPKWPSRTITNALLYILRSGQPWRMLPGNFPPVTAVQQNFYAWRDIHLRTTIKHLLLMECREALEREASPSAGVIDSQSVKSGGPCGFDVGKKIVTTIPPRVTRKASPPGSSRLSSSQPRSPGAKHLGTLASKSARPECRRPVHRLRR